MDPERLVASGGGVGQGCPVHGAKDAIEDDDRERQAERLVARGGIEPPSTKDFLSARVGARTLPRTSEQDLRAL